MTFRYLKTLVFDSFYKKLRYLMFSFLNVLMLVLIAITAPLPPLILFMIFQLFPLIYTYLPFISGKLTWLQKIVQGG